MHWRLASWIEFLMLACVDCLLLRMYVPYYDEISPSRSSGYAFSTYADCTSLHAVLKIVRFQWNPNRPQRIEHQSKKQRIDVLRHFLYTSVYQGSTFPSIEKEFGQFYYTLYLQKQVFLKSWSLAYAAMALQFVTEAKNERMFVLVPKLPYRNL